MSDDVPVRVPGEAARVVDGDAAEDERHALHESVRVEADADPGVRHASEANASGSSASESTAQGSVRRPLQPAPGPAPHVHRHQAGGARGQDVVVHPVADIGDLRRREPHQLDDLREERGLGFAYAEARRRGDDVGGKRRVARPRLERLGLVPDDPGAEPERACAPEAVERVGVQILQRIRLLVPAGRLGRFRDAPRGRCAPPHGRSSRPARPRRHAAATRHGLPAAATSAPRRRASRRRRSRPPSAPPVALTVPGTVSVTTR